MSIKILEAYRVPVSKLGEFIKTCDDLVYERWKMFQYGLLMKHLFDFNQFKDTPCSPSFFIGVIPEEIFIQTEMMIPGELKNNLIASSESFINIWIDGRYAYTTPHNVRGIMVARNVVDYHFNDRDIPEGTTRAQYQAREEKWKYLKSTPKLVHTCATIDGYNIETRDLIRRLTREIKPWEAWILSHAK